MHFSNICGIFSFKIEFHTKFHIEFHTFLKCHLYLISVFDIQEGRKSNGLKGLISAGENIGNFFSDSEQPTIWLTMGDVTCGC